MQDNFEIPKLFNLSPKETNKMKLNKNFMIFLGIGLLILIVLGFFGYRYIAPFGTKITYQFTSDKNRDKASGLLGADKSGAIETNTVNSLIIPQQIIRNNIVTFNLKLLSKKIDGIWVNLKFKGDPWEIKIGVRGSEKESYLYQPLYNQILNSLSWNQTTEGKTTFWQREKKYKDISELVSKPLISDQPKVASYFYNLSDIVMKENSSSLQSNIKIEKILRGTHTLLVKVDKKPLLLTVAKQDANVYKGGDKLLIQIYNNQNKIAEQLIPDDGVINSSSLMMTPQKGEIKINDIKPGIYTIVLKDMTQNADIRIKSVEVNQPSLVFQAHVFVVNEKPTTLWTNSKKIMMRTQHPAGIQTVKLDDKVDLKVEKLGQDLEFDLTNPESKNANSSANNASVLHKLDIPKNDLIFNGDGYFSFSESSFFNPEPIKIVELSQVTELDKIDYVIANYQKVKKDGDWNIAQIYVDPKDIIIDGDKLYFSLETPDLSQNGGEIAMDSLEVTVDKPGWFDSAKQNSISNKPFDQTQGKQDEGILDHVKRGFTDIINFFKNLWPFKTENNESGIKNNAKPTPREATNTPTPTPTFKERLKITVQNGGAVEGAAGKYMDVLKTGGFKNIKVENAANADFKNATISYNKDDEEELGETLDKFKEILSKEYKIINTNTKEDKGKIVVILGEIPKPTPIASPSPTVKPK